MKTISEVIAGQKIEQTGDLIIENNVNNVGNNTIISAKDNIEITGHCPNDVKLFSHAGKIIKEVTLPEGTKNFDMRGTSFNNTNISKYTSITATNEKAQSDIINNFFKKTTDQETTQQAYSDPSPYLKNIYTPQEIGMSAFTNMHITSDQNLSFPSVKMTGIKLDFSDHSKSQVESNPPSVNFNAANPASARFFVKPPAMTAEHRKLLQQADDLLKEIDPAGNNQNEAIKTVRNIYEEYKDSKSRLPVKVYKDLHFLIDNLNAERANFSFN